MFDDSGCRFPRTARLISPRQFRNVFDSPEERSSDRHFAVLTKTNGSAISRLGLAIAKKHLRRAVDRNRIKRLIRETFRQSRYDLAGRDFVVIARSGVATRPSSQLCDSLNRHWRRLSRNGAK